MTPRITRVSDLLKHKVQLIVLQFVNDGFHFHPNGHVINGNGFVHSAEYAVVTVIDTRERVGHILAEPRGGKSKGAEGEQFALALYLEPFHVANEAFGAVCSRGEVAGAALLALRPLDLALFQIVYEIIDPGQSRETHRPEFTEPIINFLCHIILSQR